MATSANHITETHEQIEYEQGFLMENCVACGVETVRDKKGNTLGLTFSTEDTHTDDQRKPPLSEQGRSRTKSVGA
jgi:hypothetical protein